MKGQKLVLILLLCCINSVAQLNPVSYNIPMRDGKFLAADLYLPNDDSLPRPTILIQTPYNKNFYPILGLPVQVGHDINSSPYNFVIADWRCFYGSAAACTTSVNRGEDGYDCVEWIAAQPWSIGEVGTWGPSALGIIQFQTAKENPPHLKCGVPIVAGMRTDYQRYFPGGVFRTEYVQMLDALGYGLSSILLAHPVYDIYWTIAEASSFYPSSIQVPMFMIGGWYDHATEEVLESFEGLRTQSGIAVRGQHKLLMGPWTHNTASAGLTSAGELSFPQAANASDSLAREFFDYHLLSAFNGWDTRPVVEYFQPGEGVWKSDTSWNNSGITGYNLYFHPSGELNLNTPSGSADSLLILYDPRDPSPTVGGPTLHTTLDQGPYDQAPVVESRNDILSFTTAVLTEDVVMRGRPTVHLKVSSDQLDTDFSVRLTDVYPDGRSMLVLDGIRRLRFRSGYTAADTSVIIPGSIYPFDIDLFSNTAITFPAGHQIRVDITSSNYPRFDLNLNNGQTMYASGDTLYATNTVYLNNLNASYITLPLEAFPSAIEAMKIEGITVFPNPSADFIQIQTPGFGEKRITLCDARGAVVFSKVTVEETSQLVVEKYHPGIYFLSIVTADKVFTARIGVAR